MPTTRELFEKYASAVAFVAVELPDGTPSIGSAFHVGDGVFITARHVVENATIREIATTVGRYEPDPQGLTTIACVQGSFTYIPAAQGVVRAGPYFHPNVEVDVAALVVDGINAPVIPLGGHLDDWINDDEFILRKVLVMGYPPVPLSGRSILVASHAEVNAVVDQYIGPHPRFIVSTMARGGFSGAPCLIEWDFALGLVTSALVADHGPVESGFMSVITVEPILECLAAHRLMPKALAALWDGLLTSQTMHFGKPEKNWAQAWIKTDRDGHRTRLEFACPAPKVVEAAIEAARETLANISYDYRVKHADVHEFELQGSYGDLDVPLRRAATAVQSVLERNGFEYVERPTFHARTLNEAVVPGPRLQGHAPDDPDRGNPSA